MGVVDRNPLAVSVTTIRLQPGRPQHVLGLVGHVLYIASLAALGLVDHNPSTVWLAMNDLGLADHDTP